MVIHILSRYCQKIIRKNIFQQDKINEVSKRGIFKHPVLLKNDDIGNEMFEFMAKEMWMVDKYLWG